MRVVVAMNLKSQIKKKHQENIHGDSTTDNTASASVNLSARRNVSKELIISQASFLQFTTARVIKVLSITEGSPGMALRYASVK